MASPLEAAPFGFVGRISSSVRHGRFPVPPSFGRAEVMASDDFGARAPEGTAGERGAALRTSTMTTNVITESR